MDVNFTQYENKNLKFGKMLDNTKTHIYIKFYFVINYQIYLAAILNFSKINYILLKLC